MAFAAHGNVKADIALQPLSAINDILERLRKSDVASRVVLDFDPARDGRGSRHLVFPNSPTSGVRHENLARIRDHFFSDSDEGF